MIEFELFLSCVTYCQTTILAIKAGTLDTPCSPLNQCCNQTSYAMQFARRVHSNITLKGGGGRMEIEYLKKKHLIMYKCPNYFCPRL